MANPWLRLWVDMPNDPKWRTIAKVSGTSTPLVLSVYLHILVSASNATERGRTQGLQIEDISSALDTDVEKIGDVLKAMQGRVLQGDVVSGWDKRQPIREDSSAERAKQWRERNRTQPNAVKRPEEIQIQNKDSKTPSFPTKARPNDAFMVGGAPVDPEPEGDSLEEVRARFRAREKGIQ